MYIIFLILALVAGAVLPLQALLNARLGTLVAGPVWASAVSFAVGTIGLALYIVASRSPTPDFLAAWQGGPWWLWTGGLLGGFYVVAATAAIPQLGAAALVALIIVGQMAASLMLDHYGVLGPTLPVDASRLIGAALLIAGAYLIIRP